MIPLPQKINIVSEEGRSGIYEIEGLYPGYGMTIGNAMRRALLSSLVGSAITGVKIENVNHEFSTLPGVREDIIEIGLNLKQVRFKMHGEGPYAAVIKAEGERTVLAGDIITPSQIEVVNPKQHIATLTEKKASFVAELTVERGIGYQTVESRSKEKVSIGTIALDAAFSPVRLVNYEVENMRVGDRTDYNRIRFHIETDGSIMPRKAFCQSAQILVEQFEALSNAFAEVEQSEQTAVAAKEHEEISLHLFDQARKDRSYEEVAAKKKIDELEFSTRVMNALNSAGIKTAGQLSKKSEKKLREVEGLGERGIAEVKKALGNLGLTLKQ